MFQNSATAAINLFQKNIAATIDLIQNNIAAAIYLFQNNIAAAINGQDNLGNTPLHLAAQVIRYKK